MYREQLLANYIHFKQRALFCLVNTDGLGLLESGIFDSFEDAVFGSPLHAPAQLDETMLDKLQNTLQLSRQHAHPTSPYSTPSKTPSRTRPFDTPEQECNLPLQMAYPEPHPQNSLQDVSAIEPDQLQAIFAQYSGDSRKLLSKVKEFISQENLKMIRALNEARSSCDCASASAARSTSTVPTRRHLEDREKELGRKELVIILREKSLTQGKAQLEADVQELAERTEYFQRDIQTRIADLERTKMELEQRQRDLTLREEALSSRAQDPAEDGGSGPRLELLKERVRFQQARRHTLLELERKNSILENILPGLRNLNDKMRPLS